MATAYSAFANDGISVDAHTIVRIETFAGDKEFEYARTKPKGVMKEQTAAYMTEMLQGVISPGGTGRSAAIDRPVAGKTGSTQSGIQGLKSNYLRDAWFVGYTPEWTAAVWMGYDKTDKDHLLKKSSSAAAKLFATVMSQAMRDVPRGSFVKAPPEQPASPPADKADQVKDLSGSYNENGMLISLRWTPVSGSGISYRIYRKDPSQAAYTQILETQSAGSADDLGVAPGLTYEYYVAAYNSADRPGRHAIALKSPLKFLKLRLPTPPNQPNNGNLTMAIRGADGRHCRPYKR